MSGPAMVPHVPLERAALCLDCDSLFEVGAQACPSCTSVHFIPVERFLRRPAAGSLASRRVLDADRRVLLGDVLHHAGNGLTPARIYAERLVAMLEILELTRGRAALQIAASHAERILAGIDDTIARLHALAPQAAEAAVTDPSPTSEGSVQS